MKEVIYRDGIRQSAELGVLAPQATKLLEEILGASGGLVTAEWDRGEDARGQAVVILRLSDFSGSVTATFEPTELESPAHLRARLRRLWGELLQVRSHKQLQELLGASGG